DRRGPKAHVEARVTGQARVVREPEELIARAPEPRVGEGQAQAFQQRVDAEGREQQQTRREEQVRRPRLPATASRHAQSGSALIWRARSSIAAFAGFCPV